MSCPRRTAAKGKVTVALDFRNPRPANARVGDDDTSRYTDLSDVLVLLTLLQELIGGEGIEVFFDFGVVSITNVDLTALRSRVENHAPAS